MSRNNKVNPDHYKLAGRLTPDELARQRVQQGEQQLAAGRRNERRAPIPPWMVNDESRRGAPGDTNRAARVEQPDKERAAGERDTKTGAGMPRRQAARKSGAAASRKRNRPAPRRKTTGAAAGTARRASKKASGARDTPRSRKAPASRGSAARGSSPRRAGKRAARAGKPKGRR